MILSVIVCMQGINWIVLDTFVCTIDLRQSRHGSMVNLGIPFIRWWLAENFVS